MQDDSPPEALLDINLVATMIPFASRALRVHHARVVTGKMLDPDGALGDLTCTFEAPTDGKLRFHAQASAGSATGVYELAQGFPTRISLESPARITVVRE